MQTPLSFGHLPLAGEKLVVVNRNISSNEYFKIQFRFNQKRTASPPAKGESA